MFQILGCLANIRKGCEARSLQKEGFFIYMVILYESISAVLVSLTLVSSCTSRREALLFVI